MRRHHFDHIASHVGTPSVIRHFVPAAPAAFSVVPLLPHHLFTPAIAVSITVSTLRMLTLLFRHQCYGLPTDPVGFPLLPTSRCSRGSRRFFRVPAVPAAFSVVPLFAPPFLSVVLP